METEDLLASALMGFLLGLFAFVAGYVRVRRWSGATSPAARPDTAGQDDRYHPGQVTNPSSMSFRTVIEQFFAFDRLVDLVSVLFVVAMLVYGAVVAPRLRYILAAALITVAVTWWVFRLVRRWLPQR